MSESTAPQPDSRPQADAAATAPDAAPGSPAGATAPPNATSPTVQPDSAAVPAPGEPLPEPPDVSDPGYRVSLDAYSGPLDLLLYLIRKEEVDIYDIPIARIAEQYRLYLEVMAAINVNVAGEFIVMAATLMEIKSRMLLPAEEGLEDEEEDPRAELVRQLLEYKRYKDLARELGSRAEEQSLKFARPSVDALAGEPPGPEEAEAPDNFLDGVGLWELIDAFAKVLSETSIGPPQTRVLERERPIHEIRLELLALITERGRIPFSQVFAECKTREEMIAMFVALLELVRLKRLGVQQVGEFGEIYVMLYEERAGGPVEPAEPVVVGPAPQATPAPVDFRQPRLPRPDALKVREAIRELEEESDSLGRARERIDAAIERVEAYLKEHHREQMAADGEPGAAPPLTPVGAEPAQPDATPAALPVATPGGEEPRQADATPAGSTAATPVGEANPPLAEPPNASDQPVASDVPQQSGPVAPAPPAASGPPSPVVPPEGGAADA